MSDLRDVLHPIGKASRGPTREDDLGRAFDAAHRQYLDARPSTYRDAISQEQRIVELEQQVARLSTALLAIVHRLHVEQIVDARRLGEQLFEAVARLDGAPRPPEPSDPNVVVCAGCQKHVPRATTYVTGRGTMCGACWDGKA